MNEPESFPRTNPGTPVVPNSPPTLPQQHYPNPVAGTAGANGYASSGAPTPAAGMSPSAGKPGDSGTPVWVWITAAAVVITMISLVGVYFMLSRDSVTAAPSSTSQGPDAPAVSTGSAADQSDANPVPSPGQSQAPGDAASSPANTTKVGQWYHAGTYQLPGELQPGLYRVGFEWWKYDEAGALTENSSSRDGTTLMLIPENAPKGSVDLSGGAWLVDKSKPLDALQYLDGTYLVGVDIQPGTYRITALQNMSNMAYAARLNETLEVIDNHLETADDTENVVTIEVLPTDFAFDFVGRIEKIG